MKNTEQKECLVHLEIMRVIAAFFVIFNHTGDSGFSMFYQYEPNTIFYWIYLFFTVVCKISVPLFFMISGALLLQKSNEKPQVLAKRFFRIAMALMVFSFLSYLQQVYIKAEVFDIKRFFVVLVENNWMSPYWYLYAFLGYLLTLPFMRVLVQKMEEGHYLYLIVLQILFGGILPTVLYLLWQGEHHINSNFSVGWMLGYFPIYPIVGYFLENKLDMSRLNGKKLGVMWMLNLGTIIFTCYMTYYNCRVTNSFSQTYLMSFVLINCITIYITAKMLMQKIRVLAVIGKGIVGLGKLTFGIYLLHGLLLRAPVLSVWNRIISQININPMISCFVRCFEVMMIAAGITWLLKKIPMIRKLL